jgi:hypothetical protein
VRIYVKGYTTKSMRIQRKLSKTDKYKDSQKIKVQWFNLLLYAISVELDCQAHGGLI